MDMTVLRSRASHAENEAWCIDADTRYAVVARRNVLTALWAGRLLGRSGDDLARYAQEVHVADFELPGDEDVVAKLRGDLETAGLRLEAAQVRLRLAQYQRQAWRECGATD
jgi:hypothetical protein